MAFLAMKNTFGVCCGLGLTLVLSGAGRGDNDNV
jgi:hypothetical protein